MDKQKKDPMAWQVLESEYLFKQPWLTARREHVKLPTGAEIKDFYVLEYPDWVNVIAITEDGQFVMERQYRHGLGKTCFEIPAGVMEKDETPLEAAKRELMEETGYGEGEWTNIMNVSGNSSTTNNISHCFVAKGVKKISGQHLDSTEDLEIVLLSRDQVKDLMVNDQIRQSLMAAPLWRFFAEEK